MRNMAMTSCDMHEELFIEILYSEEPVPLDKDSVALEGRYYKTFSGISNKYKKYSAICALTKLYKEAHFYDRAITVCKQALRSPLLKGFQAYFYDEIGKISQLKRDFDIALNFYHKGLDIGLARTSQHGTYNNVAFCYLIKKEFTTAEKYCLMAIDIDYAYSKPSHDSWDRNWNAWKNMGVAKEHTGRYLEAASCYTTAITLSPGGELAVLHLRRLLERHPELAKT